MDASQAARLAVPLVVNLDDTLIRTDVLMESAVLLVRRNPFALGLLLWWFVRGGRAHLKARLAASVAPKLADLPYRRNVLDFLRSEHAAGRTLVLATGSDQAIARSLAALLGIFSETLASDGRVNLSGENKRRRLVQRWGERGYDYLGSDFRDLAVWRSARLAILVAPTSRLRRRVARVATIACELEEPRAALRDWLGALRARNWLKNLLVFAPLAAAHRFGETTLVASSGLAVLAFCLSASSVYLFNDLFDLEADRRHPHKRSRPIADGRIALGNVLGVLVLLLAASVVCALQLPASFGVIVAIYYVLNLAYSLGLKDVPILDVMLLAAFHASRMLGGGAAVGIGLSAQLLTFAMFLFLSLGLTKRYAELLLMRGIEGHRARARGYRLEDAELLAAQGAAAGYVAVLVLALYIDSEASHLLYGQPRYLWGSCVVLFYWISHLWMMAHRRRLNDDPLVFALHDPLSRLLLAAMAAMLVLAL